MEEKNKRLPLAAVLLAGVILLSVSCSDENFVKESSGGAIAFNTDVTAASELPTRASVADLSKLQIDGFNVSAFSTGTSGWSSSGATATPNFMYAQPVSWNSDHWEYSPLKYWPDKADGTNLGKVSFFAWSPASAGTPSLASAQGAPTLTITVTDDNASQVDLIADMLTDKSRDGGAVNFAFDHLLSRIGFMARLDEEYADATVQVTSIKIKYIGGKVANTGVYTFNTDNTASTIWSLTAATASSMTTSDTGDRITESALTLTTANQRANDADKYLMLLPQTVQTGDVKAEVTWTVTTTNPVATETNTKTLDLPAQVWLPGKRYDYKLVISLTDVVFDNTIVNPWGDDCMCPA
ncbi:MAG: fimbrillin family protein [Prevotella sp.]|nr:fimbrillin family protein [Prevotella sp.]